jgi:hypothetical protein
LIITAVVAEGRSKTDVARDYGVSRYWVQQLVQRYQREGPIVFWPRSRRPHHSPHPVDADTEEMIIRLRKELFKQGLDAGAETTAAHLACCQSAGSGRPVPAVSTIWRILPPALLSIHNRGNRPGQAGACSALSSPTNAGRPTSPIGGWPTAPK